MALVNVADGTETARYEYGPFGEPLRMTGPMARENPFRFSAKRMDNTTNLVLYEYRIYNPSIGRWLSRDPIEEFGGFNLYGFVGNSPMSRVDILGLIPPISVIRSLPNRDYINKIAGVSFHRLVQDQPIHHYDAFGRLDGTIGFAYADLRLDRPTSADPRWPHIPSPPGPSLSAIQICTRDIDKRGAGCWDWCILGIANALSGHVYLDYGIDANGNRRGVGFNDPNGKAGAPPTPEKDLDKFPPRHCNSCWKVGRTLQYGSDKGKKGAEASDDEIWECLHLAPLLKDYGGLCNNCRHWAYSAAERCGLLCLSY